VIDAVVDCAARLRRAGVEVPLSATVEATEALRHVDIGEREQVRTALVATLIKRSADLVTFARIFDRCFPASPPDDRDLSPVGDVGPTEQVASAIATGGGRALDDLARRLVERYAGLASPRSSERYHVQRVERAVDISGAFQTALRAGREGGERRPALEERLARAEIEARLQRFRRELREQVHRRLADELGLTSLSTPLEETDFLRASTTELRAMRDAVRPLARRIGAHLSSRDRRLRRGRVDMRRTIRASLGSGGVALDPAYHRRRRTRPDLWLLCDVSGSVAEFARFMLAFVYVMHEEFPRIRAFVFVDDVEEVTGLLTGHGDGRDPFRLLAGAGATLGRRRSDYGRALECFWSRYGMEVGPWATVIVSGDARSHDRDPRGDVLGAIASRARRVWFLNPEPRATWGRGDSVASLYEGICHHMAEVRNLRQLAACVADLV